MKTMHRAGSLAALQASNSLGVTLGGQRVAIFCVKGNVIATSGKCPHAGGMIHSGEIDGNSVSCPWHGFTYDLTTGACNEDATLVLDIYPVSVEGDDIMVTL